MRRMQYKNIYQAIIDEEESYAFSDTIGYKQILYITETRGVVDEIEKLTEIIVRYIKDNNISPTKRYELLLNYSRKL